MSILDRIALYKREEVARAKQAISPTEIVERAKGAEPPRGFLASLEVKKKFGQPALIAEVKKASPSKGLIRADFDPPVLARAYEQGGATCLSVLTDAPSFQGAPEYLSQARNATALPVLRKDFMFDPYQVAESRAWNADAILIIMAMVDDDVAAQLMAEAARWHMDALVEVHDGTELSRALKLAAPLIGINNRDLNSFVTDLTVSERLVSTIPPTHHVVAESGLGRPEDLRRLAKAGITTYLIGESLMREPDVAMATRALLEGAVQ